MHRAKVGSKTHPGVTVVIESTGEEGMHQSRSKTVLAAVVLLAVAPWGQAIAEDPVSNPIDHGFLSLSYEEMRMEKRDKGFDLIFVAPGAFERIGDYEAVMIDQPEIWIDGGSDYPGTKPDYLKAIVDLIRDELTGALIRGGHDVVEAPGPNVAFIRIALTDLYLKKKPGKQTRGYTSINSDSPERILKTMLKYFDVVEMALQLEVVDLDTEELLGAIVIQRGERDMHSGKYDQRLDFAEFLDVVEEYAGRLRCRFANGRLPKDEWMDCITLSGQGVATLATRAD